MSERNNDQEPTMTTPTTVTYEQQQQLMAPLNRNRVATRKQGDVNLSYLEAWDVKAALIRVFGFGQFSAEVIQSEVLYREQVPNSRGDGTNWKIAAQATVRLQIHQTGAVYTETAVAGSAQPDVVEAIDMALKSAESDALKRAAIYLGTQFGLSLYDNGSTSDVVRVVLAPGQEWPRPAPQRTPQQAQASEERVAEGTGIEAMTEEQRAEAQGLVNHSLTAKRERDGEPDPNERELPGSGGEQE